MAMLARSLAVYQPEGVSVNMNKALRFVVSFLVVAFAVHGLSSCTVTQGAITLGAIFPLTGEAGQYGQDAKAGIDLALEERDATKPAKSVKVIYEDDQANPTTSISAFRKLVTVDRVKAVLGPLTSSSALALAPIAQQEKVVLLSPSASAAALTKPDDFFFRNELSDAKGAAIQAEQAFNKLKYKKIAILYINNDYGVGVKDGFTQSFKTLGGNVLVTESFEANAQDFRTQLTKIRQVSPEALFLVAQKETVLILRQMKELAVKTQILSTPLFEDPAILEKAKGEAEGAIYAYYGEYNAQSSNEKTRNFVNAFKKKHGKEPSYYSALAYDAASIMIAAIEKNSSSSQAIANSLISTRNFPGITGNTSFNSDGDVTKPILLKKVDNGKFKFFQL
jgi:branched-chain amino acid transport system substrate-binding protein